MEKLDYLEMIENKLKDNSKRIMTEQIERYYKANTGKVIKNNYKIGDDVYLKKGTLLHGTYKNLDGLEEIIRDGLISSWFINSRRSKYPSSVGVWNLGKDYYLKDYINFYSGGTIKYFNQHDNTRETEVISFDEMSNIMDRIIRKGYLVWNMEETKEARFLPSLVQNKVQIGIIFNGDNQYVRELLKGDILNPDNVSDNDAVEFVNEDYYERFIIDRKNKDDFFTNRESAILFGIPANMIEGVLVGRDYEKNISILDEIKRMLPDCYICNLEGKVIR